MNVTLDKELLEKARELTGLGSRRALLEEALRTLIRLREQEKTKALRGKLPWDGDLDQLRRSRFANPR